MNHDMQDGLEKWQCALDYAHGLSDAELVRHVRIMHKRIREYFAGGLSFGWDWPTLMICYPHLGLALRAFLREGRNRGLGANAD